MVPPPTTTSARWAVRRACVSPAARVASFRLAARWNIDRPSKRCQRPTSFAVRYMPNGRRPDRGDGGGVADDLHLRDGPSPEQVQQDFAGWSDEISGRFAATGPHPLVRARPLELEPDVAEAPGEEPRCPSDVAPQRRIEIGRVAPRLAAVGPAHVFVMDEELVESRKPRTHPMRKKPGGGPDLSRCTSEAKSPSASSAVRRSAKRCQRPGTTRPGAARRSCSRSTR